VRERGKVIILKFVIFILIRGAVLNMTGTMIVPHHWSDESLVLWRFSCKALANITDFGYHALPGFF